jgi:hypothetical protein
LLSGANIHPVTKASALAALEELKKNSLAAVRAIRASGDSSHKMGRRMAFWTHQYMNAEFGIEDLREAEEQMA